jgi:hypothetical protein
MKIYQVLCWKIIIIFSESRKAISQSSVLGIALGKPCIFEKSNGAYLAKILATIELDIETQWSRQ